ncbi:hypothetical protein H4219_006095 [Mycoemilia scoparia]|uniref:Uncharacterized protein n=1 Tax=Mycoemilia scoparia TaxID=417184 RepID=A0A9W8DMT7_9FUNG|nr:hypothetical protein H4219_006095 [Mycoemilia scoparia]
MLPEISLFSSGHNSVATSPTYITEFPDISDVIDRLTLRENIARESGGRVDKNCNDPSQSSSINSDDDTDKDDGKPPEEDSTNDILAPSNYNETTTLSPLLSDDGDDDDDDDDDDDENDGYDYFSCLVNYKISIDLVTLEFIEVWNELIDSSKNNQSCQLKTISSLQHSFENMIRLYKHAQTRFLAELKRQEQEIQEEDEDEDSYQKRDGERMYSFGLDRKLYLLTKILMMITKNALDTMKSKIENYNIQKTEEYSDFNDNQKRFFFCFKHDSDNALGGLYDILSKYHELIIKRDSNRRELDDVIKTFRAFFDDILEEYPMVLREYHALMNIFVEKNVQIFKATKG